MGIWQGRFLSKNNIPYDVRIYDDSFDGTEQITFGSTPVVLSYDRDDDKYVPSKSIHAVIHIVTDSDMTSLYSDVPFTNKVQIEDAQKGNIIFSGYLVASEWKNEDLLTIHEVELRAVDLIGMAAEKDFGNSGRKVWEVKDLFEYAAESCGLDGGNEVYDSTTWLAGSTTGEAFLPEDFTESAITGSWPTMRDVIDGCCRFFGKTCMTWGEELFVNDADNSSVWKSNGMEDLRSDSVTLQIVPSRSRISLSPGGGQKIYINDIFSRTRTKVSSIAGKVTITTGEKTEGTLKTEEFWYVSVSGNSSKDLEIKEVTGYAKELTNVIVYREWADGDDIPKADEMQIVLWHDLGIKDDARHPILAVQDLYMTCSVYIGTNATNPHLFGVSQKESETQTESEEGIVQVLGAHMGIEVNGTTFYPTQVDNTEYDSDNNGFYEVTYHFADVESGLMRPVILSPDADNIFVKSIEISGVKKDGGYSDEYSEVEQISTLFRNSLDVEMPLMAGDTNPDYAAYVEHDASLDRTETILQRYVNQYKKPRRLWTATMAFDRDFKPWKHVVWQGYDCTMEGAEIDLRDDSVTVDLLESGNA